MTNKEIRNLTCIMTVICLLGIIFALGYPYVAHGQETGDITLENQLAGLENLLAFEQLISQNLNLKFRLNQTQIAQLENLKANIENLRRAHAQSQEKIKSLQAQILDLKNKITAASKGTPPAPEKKESQRYP